MSKLSSAPADSHAVKPVTSRPPAAPGHGGGSIINDQLRDFSADWRLLVLSLMALVVGSFGAGAAWALTALIAFCTHVAYFGVFSFAPATIAGNHLGLSAALVPVAGCLIIGLMARYGSEKIRGHGIPEALEAILIGRSRIEPKVALLKPLSSAISIGTGGPFGAEGPIIMTGGALGSLFAQLFHLSSAERKTLLVAGAAAGMSATFGTPVAALLLAVELLLFEWKPRSFVPVAIAAIVASAWRPWLLGPVPLFPMATTGDLPTIGLLFCAGIGIVGGLASGTLTAMVYKCEDFFLRLPLHWMWWPVFGGIVIGLGGLIEPHALGVGYDNIAALVSGKMTLAESLRLIAVKSVIWSVALGSGTSGGVLAPLLMMGGAIGAVIGSVLPTGDIGLWALLGMAAMMGGTMRAPLTAIVFSLELTHNMGALLPLSVACVMAHGTTVLLLRRSILTEKVARRGYHIIREYIVDPLEQMRVIDIMARPVESLPSDMTVKDAVVFFTAEDAPKRHKSYPVINDDRQVVAMVARADVLRWMRDDTPNQTLGADKTLGEHLAGQRLVTGYDDELVSHVVDRMVTAEAGRVPILRRQDNTLVGLVARRDILRVRANSVRQEHEREALMRVLPRLRAAADKPTA
jgi:H+/Cl- antiporter ClcA/predicted transcriptional regulator